MFYESSFLRGSNKAGWKGVLKYKDDQGVWRQRQKSLKATRKREAQDELDEWHDEMEAKAQAEAGRKPDTTVAEYVARYIEENAGSVEATTAEVMKALEA